MKVTIFETEAWEEAAFHSHLAAHDLCCTSQALDEAHAEDYADSEVISTFISSVVQAPVLRHLPALKLIVTRSVGFDHIDLNYCRAHGITVCNIPDYGDYAVAEHAFALLLALNRRILAAVESCRSGTFDDSRLRGTELRDKTLAVIGTGRIGLRAIEIAKGFGMTVLAQDLRPNQDAARTLGFDYASLEEVLAEADAVTLHVPGSPATHHLLADREFAAMKHGVVIINTARGTVIDPEALVRALESGKVSGAGLDVLPFEPIIRDEAQVFRTTPQDRVDFRGLVADHILLRHPKVLVTPHNAYNTVEARQRIVASTIAEITAFSEGHPENVVKAA